MKLWEDNFKHLWNKLEEDYSIKNNGGISWCNNKYPLLQKTEYPQGLAPFNYDESVSQETKAVTSLQTDHSPETVLPQEVDRTKNLAFTPMMSWFRRPGMNNVGTDLYMNPGGAESFLSMQKDNGSNNLFYHP
ncbi:hypothetical protein PVIIG_06277 [Plasmodium vivax India VII]|uniref:Uncharacterized protein n=1 Tax=Plasmodium vivax India VII TaxID=1077284 RepID=A0A0J9UT95_PLAVI|nr:hypothetical protein PVIIG_06277 [Plasmodium vivax India VII]